ncbi:MAG TPA: calcium/proton exchanger [Chloroflexota bacterium]|nr:calcium/proton exchanger [Chloroflexota bacterium]
MPRWFYALLLLTPAALAAGAARLPPLVVFAVSAASLVPLAWLIGRATEEVAHHLGPRYGGLLNATFGNTAELIITALAIHRGLLTLVKASITGSIISNTLFSLGLSLLVGGFRNGRQGFDSRDTSLNAAMMILAVASLYLPAIFASSVREHAVIEELSLFIAGVLLVTYAGYVAYTVTQGHSAEDIVPNVGAESGVATAGARAAPGGAASSARAPLWSRRRGLLVLAAAGAGAAISGDLLVDSVEPVIAQLGWSELFVGVIIVPLVGNAAEYFSAVQMAWRDRLDVTLSIAAGSSTQVALFVAPVLVFLSLALGHPMDVIFTPLELAILGLATAIFAYVSMDGKSNWLEGMQLLAVYLVAVLAFYFLPVPP